MINKVEICGVNTAKLPLLSKKEKEELLIKIKTGDNQARDIFVNGNLRLVLSIIQRFYGRGESADDLFQIGCIGLIKAIDNFDLKHEVRFSTYAVPMILGEVKRYLRDNTALRITRSIKDLCIQILKTNKELILKYGRTPTSKELANTLGIDEYELTNALDSMKDTMSMFEPIYNDGTDTIYLCDQLYDKTGTLYDVETKLALKEALIGLKEKEKYIIIERYLMGKTQMELSNELNISQAQISRLEKTGIEHIKKLIK